MNSAGRKILDGILCMDYAKEAVEYMVKEYAKQSVENARHLIQLISDLSDIMLAHKEKEVSKYREASFWLIVQKEMDEGKADDRQLFASMVTVCMARFPNGTNEGCCNAEKKYFLRFLELFKNKKVFSWEKDKTWADQYGYTDYLKLVEEKMNAT